MAGKWILVFFGLLDLRQLWVCRSWFPFIATIAMRPRLFSKGDS
jgi:hypothetical protein